jgi:hypothetical protein
MAGAGTASERHFRIYSRNPWRRLRRDVWVFLYLAKIVWLWWRVGGRLRRAARRARGRKAAGARSGHGGTV